MEKQKLKPLGVILTITGLILIVASVILFYGFQHDSKGLIGGGLALVGAGITFIQKAKSKN